MTIVRVNAGSWSVGAKLTSAQANGLDLNTVMALDKRSGQTDTLQSVVSRSSGGRIVPTYLVGTDAGTTYQVSSGIDVIDASGITANRIYTLSTTGAIAGDRCIVQGSPSFAVTVNNQTPTTLAIVGGLGVVSGAIAPRSMWGEFEYTGTVWKLLRLGGEQLTTRIVGFHPDSISTTTYASASADLFTKPFVPIAAANTQTVNDGTVMLTVNTGSTAAYVFRQPLEQSVLPNGATLTSAVVTLIAGAHSGLPQQMPAMSIMAWNDSGGVSAAMRSATLGWVLDASGSTGVYQASHAITYTTTQSNVIDHSNFTYALYIMGEGGSNALTNLSISKIALNMTF